MDRLNLSNGQNWLADFHVHQAGIGWLSFLPGLLLQYITQGPWPRQNLKCLVTSCCSLAVSSISFTKTAQQECHVFFSAVEAQL